MFQRVTNCENRTILEICPRSEWMNEIMFKIINFKYWVLEGILVLASSHMLHVYSETLVRARVWVCVCVCLKCSPSRSHMYVNLFTCIFTWCDRNMSRSVHRHCLYEFFRIVYRKRMPSVVFITYAICARPTLAHILFNCEWVERSVWKFWRPNDVVCIQCDIVKFELFFAVESWTTTILKKKNLNKLLVDREICEIVLVSTTFFFAEIREKTKCKRHVGIDAAVQF